MPSLDLELVPALTRALDSLSKQYKGTALGPVVDRLGLAVRKGETLSEAAAREPRAWLPGICRPQSFIT